MSVRYSGIVTAAAADIVMRGVLSHDTRIITAACRLAAAVSHGALTGIALRAEKAARNFAAATDAISRTDAVQKSEWIRCVGCED